MKNAPAATLTPKGRIVPDGTKLREAWYSVEDSGFDLRLSGIYEWRIPGSGLYVGKALVLRSRISSYPNNVRRMLKGEYWHGDPTRDYRPIHHELRAAYEKGTHITVHILEICEPSQRAIRERWWIQKRREEASKGGMRVLNAN